MSFFVPTDAENDFDLGVPPNWLTEEIMDRYALELAKNPQSAFLAARVAAPNGDHGYASDIMQWAISDQTFPDRMRRVVEEAGPEQFVPSKEMATFEILSIGRNPNLEGDLRLRAYRLAAEMNGWITKGDNQVNVQVTQNRVMVVPMPEDGKWEDYAGNQQRTLIEHAANS